MGELPVPDDRARIDARSLADRILDAIRNDDWPAELKLELFGDPAAVTHSLWLLASALVYAQDGDPNECDRCRGSGVAWAGHPCGGCDGTGKAVR